MFRVCTDAHARVKAQMQELSIVKNDASGYEYKAVMTLLKQINRVLEQQLFEDSVDGIVEIGSESPKTLKQIQIQRRNLKV